LDPSKKTARILGTGDTKFSATNLRTIGQAVAKVLLFPTETANRNIHISSFEVSLHQVLRAEQEIVGREGWSVTYANAEEEIEEATKDFKETGNYFALGKLALCVEVMEGVGANFADQGLLNNELLGLFEAESVEDGVARVLADTAI
jgi:hypothetical protein